METIGEKYLPIGTVVMLKGGSKRVMITGFCSMATEDQSKMYDYSGCMYPEGFLSSDQTALFNHDQIEKIYYMGLIDEEEKNFKATLNSLVSSMNGSTTVKQPVNTNPSTTDAVPPIGPGLSGIAPQQTVTNQAPTNNFSFETTSFKN